MGHKNGIGPQSLGTSGMNPKSTPCGHPKITPLDFNASLRSELGKGTLNTGFENAIKENDPALNPQKKTESDSPIDFNAFENADPRAAVNMMSDMAPTGSGNTSLRAPDLGPPTIPDADSRGIGGPFGGLGRTLRRKAGRTGRGSGALGSLAEKTGSLPGFGSAGPTVNSPGGGSGGAIASAEAAQASADAANSQMDALKEKLSGIRSQLDSLSGMI
jgi:hypothetical protein